MERRRYGSFLWDSHPLYWNDAQCGMRAFHEALAGRFGAALARGFRYRRYGGGGVEP